MKSKNQLFIVKLQREELVRGKKTLLHLHLSGDPHKADKMTSNFLL